MPISSKNKTVIKSETLEEAQARADALFLSIGVGAIAIDEQGKIYRINNVALDILGYKEKELLGQWFPRVISALNDDGAEVDVMDRPITQALLTGKPISAKMYYCSKSGSHMPVSVTVSPIVLNGKPIGAVEVFYDNSLENEVDRMKSEFIFDCLHQLRTPLSAINTYANMLSSGYEGELNKGQQAQMQIILSAVDRMNQLITTLLDISKLEAGALSVRSKETNIVDLVSTVINEMEQFAKAKKIKLSVSTPPQGILAECDPLLLGEVYTNLISNAIKYTPEGGMVKIKISLKRQEVIFTVSDTGYGIPQDLQDQVFTKFFRASNIQKHDTTGTGLGLYMVKQIADVMGGRLWFKSAEGKGSEFCFAIPAQYDTSEDS